MGGSPTDREWLWVVGVSLIALALTSVPYVLGLSLETGQYRFGGFVYAVEDGYSYLAKMHQGALGAWLFHIAYTPEPHPPALFFAFHLVLGRLAALLPGDDLTARLILVYHAARLAFGLVLLLTVYRFLSALTGSVEIRRLGFLLVAFGGGLGWLLVALGQPEWLGSLPLDYILPEGFTFLVLYAFPHIALGRTLLLWGLLFLLRAWGHGPASQTSSPGWALAAGLAWLAMGLIVPFYVLVAWAVTGALWAALAWRRRRLPWPEGRLAMGAVAISAPVVLYSVWIFTSNAVYATWAAQNRILSPHPLHYLAAFGLLLVLAGCAVPGVWAEKGWGWAAIAWVAVVPLLVYLPFNLQRRLVEGVQVPLSLLAAQGALEVLAPRWRMPRNLVVVALLAALLPSNALLLAGNSQALLSRPSPVFRDAAEVAALDWLSLQARPEEVVLSSFETGNYLPARVGARVFVGHGPETVDSDQKRALVARFFDAGTDQAWRESLLGQYGLDWVFWGPAERALGDFDPHTASYLHCRYEVGGYAVFEVQR